MHIGYAFSKIPVFFENLINLNTKGMRNVLLYHYAVVPEVVEVPIHSLVDASDCGCSTPIFLYFGVFFIITTLICLILLSYLGFYGVFFF